MVVWGSRNCGGKGLRHDQEHPGEHSPDCSWKKPPIANDNPIISDVCLLKATSTAEESYAESSCCVEAAASLDTGVANISC